ncbi:SixA phosphatase family protein [Hanstruepera marina]|uniref:SixA phosphatase family protein n=1 Tax=Hanstruepera marina TaxID=2873265 RepID=UPI001CA76716|nr:histidine phosphatase family protein [Hanstruepera marina]
MKNLILVRHAKSSWEYDVIDHERPLKTRGITDAGLVSSHFHELNLTIDLVIVSDAIRTKLTAEIFKSNLNFDEKIMHFSHNLYDFSGENLNRVITNCEDSIKNLMVFGHNYAITNFANTFGSQYFENVPTSGLVWLQFDTNQWQNIKNATTKLHLFPKELKS